MAKQTFKYTISIETETQAQSIQVMEAITKLIKVTSPDDLEFFANKIFNKPHLIQTAKKFL